MKKFSALNLLMVLALALLLAAGCAKKPAPESMAAPPTAAPATTQMSTQEPSGISEQAVSEQPAGGEQGQIQTAAVAGLEGITFDFDQYTLTPQATATLAANAAYMQANPNVQVRIEGYCDERGSDEYNLALGERRAQAAMNYLVSLGVAKDRLSTISYGEEMPVDPGHTEEAWAKNRRDEFKVVR
jgi:peptidoglycan-associated lipoprotein